MSESIRAELRTLWGMLRLRMGGELRSGKLPVQIGERAVCAAVDRLDSCHVLVPVPDAPDQERVWRSRAIVVSRRNLSGDDGAVKTWLDIHCRRAELESVFVHFAAAVIEAIRSEDPQIVEGACISALEEWRELLGGARLDESALIGLVGELIVLQRLAVTSTVGATECWEGPRGGRYDFRHATRAIEVKATTRRDAYQVPVHGVAQLEIPENGALHLVFLRLERVTGGALSVASLVREIVETGVSEARLLDAIASIGIDDLISDAARMAFELRELKVYRVVPGFPRIITGTFVDGRVPIGVMDVGYTIDLVGQPHECGDSVNGLFAAFFGAEQ